jgi:hypothetical protein
MFLAATVATVLATAPVLANSLAVDAGAASAGAFGLEVTFVGTTITAFVRDDSPGSDTVYRATFYLDSSGLVLDSGDSFRHFKARATDATTWFRLALLQSPTGLRLVPAARLDSGTFIAGPGLLLPTSGHARIDVQWTAASAPGANDGALQLSVDQSSFSSVMNLDNEQGAVDLVTWGAMDLPSGVTGSLLLDDFSSLRALSAVFVPSPIIGAASSGPSRRRPGVAGIPADVTIGPGPISGCYTATNTIDALGPEIVSPGGAFHAGTGIRLHDGFSVALDADFLAAAPTLESCPPPTVVQVATSAGPLASCDTVRTPVDEIEVTLSSSRGPFAGTDDAGSYLLVGAGPDGDFATDSCGAGAVGDDARIEILDLTLLEVDPTTVTARLRTGIPLAPSLYRLLVCDTITDANGIALDGDGDDTGGGDFIVPLFRADPGNRFENGDFDDCPVTLEPWIAVVTAPNTAQSGLPGADDSVASPLSASARFSHSTAEPSTLAQCVAVTPGLNHDLQASVRFLPQMGAVARFEEACEFFAESACSGASLGPVAIAAVLEDEGGVWIHTANEVSAPDGAASALCDFAVEAVSGGTDFDVFLDGLSLRLPPQIFADGFESGDVSAWSSSVP